MKFKQYLKEDYEKKDVTDPIDFSDLIEIAPQYSNALKAAYGKKSYIFRGIIGYTGKTPYVTIDLSKIGERKSAYTRNYYTLIMNHAPNWSKYPKRAIVGSTSMYKAEGYSEDNLFYVFPKNGSDVAQCLTEDIWDAFQDNLNTSLSDINDDLEKCFDAVDAVKSAERDYTSFVKACKEFDEEAKQYSEDNELSVIEYIEDVVDVDQYKLFRNYYKGNLLEMVQTMLDPKNGDISLRKAGQELSDNVEVWTDSKCLLIKVNEFDRIKEKLIESL